MSREIKFRIRDKATKKVVCCFQAGITMVPDTGELYQGGMNVTERYFREEWTGLKDKNGVEIYEGDIIKEVYFPIGLSRKAVQCYNLQEVLPWRKVKYKRKGSIVIDESIAPTCWKTEEKAHYLPSVGTNWVTDLDVFGLQNIEVIGNIHEHPHLLNPEVRESE